MYGGGGGGCWSVHFLRYWIVICKKQLKRKKNLYEIYVKHKETTGSRCQNNPLYFGALSYSPASFLAQQQRLLCSFAGKKSHNENHPSYQTEESEVTTHWDALKKELVRNKMNSFSDCGSYVELNSCPLCTNNSRRRSLPRIQKVDGSFHCVSCDENYSGPQFVERLKLLNGTFFSSVEKDLLFNRTVDDPTWLSEFATDSIRNLEENKDLIASLERSGLSFGILKDFEVGLARFLRSNSKEYDDCLVFPLRNERLELVGIKCRRLEQYEDVGYYRLGSCFGLFGLRFRTRRQDTVIVTDDEFEAMKLAESCGMAAVSLPCGINYLGEDVIQSLSQFSKINIWFGNDPLCKERACILAKKLGSLRCYIITPPEKLSVGAERPSDLIRMQIPLSPFISMAEPAIQPKYISSFTKYRNDIYDSLTDPRRSLFLTADCHSLGSFSRFTKGLRRNEVSLFVGESGVGKSTFLSQLVLDYCQQGISTIWCSFASDQSFVMKTMLQQLAAVDSKRLASHYSHFCSVFESLPLHFIDLSSRDDIEYLEEAIAYAQQRWKVSHVVVDNINIPKHFRGEKFYSPKEMLEKTLHLLKHIATTRNIHISVVTLPWIESYCRRGTNIQVTEFFGSSSIVLEADNIFFMKRATPAENLDNCRTVYILKHRWDGNVGVINYRQNLETKVLQDINDESSNSQKEQAFANARVSDNSIYSQDSWLENTGDDSKTEKELVEVNMANVDLTEWERLLDIRE
ncbi:hypothetical protein GAYE_SCF02G2183 [Galdieria yellowstonensis]|uniref:SF4 helicase domain-containing protein n=1 Tax=Galdieria yellowstonensis TaxID=3028027 RepID=A0AAV9IAM0_9RHOD|nr:hypothetical protein GAYE_SCF02G2183 [Galdieria yellowstonensis]